MGHGLRSHFRLVGRRPKRVTPRATAIGLASRYLLGSNPNKNLAYIRGCDYLTKFPPGEKNRDPVFLFFASGVVQNRGGDSWKKWNVLCRDLLVTSQKKDEKESGTWEATPQFGTLGTTCLDILTLEVYYRQMPLYSRYYDPAIELER